MRWCGSKLALIPAVIFIRGSAKGWNTAVAARVSASARISVAWPPDFATACRIEAAPTSPAALTDSQMM